MLRILCSVIAVFVVNACALEPVDAPEPAPTSVDASSSSSSGVSWACMLPGMICSCADYGCASAPSGNPLQWEPCDGGVCYCRVSDTVTRQCFA